MTESLRQDDDVLAEVRAALDVNPTPAFAARVRTRVAERRVSSHRFSHVGWRLAAAAAVVVASVGAWTWRAAQIAPTRDETITTPVAISEPSTPVASRAVIDETPIVVRSTAPPRTRGLREPAGSVMPEVEVLVPDDQRLALVRLMVNLREGRATVPLTVGPTFDEDGLLVAPAPVVIAPLPELSPTPADRNAGKDK